MMTIAGALLPEWARTDLTGARFSTYRMGGPLAEAYQPETKVDAVKVLTEICRTKTPYTIIGWGGNVVIAEQGISGVTLITRKMTWSSMASDTRIVCGAGVHLAKVAKLAETASLQGAEYMIGIPGTAGGAAKMNAGALGQDTASVIETVELFDMQAATSRLYTCDELDYAYRHSMITPERYVVLEVTFVFTKGDPVAIAEKMNGSVQFRKNHHPLEPNGGSVFRNPSPTEEHPKPQSSGQMLDQLGAKEWTQNGVRISPRHANFIINTTGAGTSSDVLTMMARMKQAVQREYGVTIFPENYLIGDTTDYEKSVWAYLTGKADTCPPLQADNALTHSTLNSEG
jgi:UDP-N-acetylmuramate dehydrogenase